MSPLEDGASIQFSANSDPQASAPHGDNSAHQPNGHEQHHTPRDSKGWDGKLRVDRRALVRGTDGGGGAESEPEEEDEGPQPEEIEADEDLTADFEDDTEEIDLVQCRISSIEALKLERFTNLQRLCLRQNLVYNTTNPEEKSSFPENLNATLKDLDLYDNLINHVRGFDGLTELTSLDLSFNKIKHIKHINHLKKLTDLYFVQNRIQKIDGLDGLEKLRNLELGGNRIREIQNLETLTALEELWLGKNKITELKVIHRLQIERLV
jgi:protein phosphatase 1 regulatory subunit 7